MSEEVSPNQPLTADERAAFEAKMAQPVTRAELIRALSQVHLNLLSHALVETAMLTENEEFVREQIGFALQHSDKITKVMRDFMQEWMHPQ